MNKYNDNEYVYKRDIKTIKHLRNIEYFNYQENDDEADEIRSEEMSQEDFNEDEQDWIDPERLQDKNKKKKRQIHYLHLVEDIGPRIIGDYTTRQLARFKDIEFEINTDEWRS